MKAFTKHFVSIVPVIAGLLIARQVSATVLIFNNAAGGAVTNNGDPIPQAYGDNVTATIQGGFSYGVGAEGLTPHVVADWGTALGGSFVTAFYDLGLGDL